MPDDFLTVKRAKELCRAANGRLPRCGREMLVAGGSVYRTVRQIDGTFVSGDHTAEWWLANYGGRYEVRVSFSFDPLGRGYSDAGSFRD